MRLLPPCETPRRSARSRRAVSSRQWCQLERLNWRGDVSEAGIRRSFGLTVNYVYQLQHLENHERYATASEVVASSSLKRLAGGFKPSPASQRKDA